jgi:hypothetical protein
MAAAVNADLQGNSGNLVVTMAVLKAAFTLYSSNSLPLNNS